VSNHSIECSLSSNVVPGNVSVSVSFDTAGFSSPGNQSLVVLPSGSTAQMMMIPSSVPVQGGTRVVLGLETFESEASLQKSLPCYVGGIFVLSSRTHSKDWYLIVPPAPTAYNFLDSVSVTCVEQSNIFHGTLTYFVQPHVVALYPSKGPTMGGFPVQIIITNLHHNEVSCMFNAHIIRARVCAPSRVTVIAPRHTEPGETKASIRRKSQHMAAAL